MFHVQLPRFRESRGLKLHILDISDFVSRESLLLKLVVWTDSSLVPSPRFVSLAFGWAVHLLHRIRLFSMSSRRWDGFLFSDEAVTGIRA